VELAAKPLISNQQKRKAPPLRRRRAASEPLGIVRTSPQAKTYPAISLQRLVMERGSALPRKPKKSAQFLDAEETVLNFESVLQPTEAARMRREAAIRRYAETVGADPDLPADRERMLGLLAWCMFPDEVKKINRRTGAPNRWHVRNPTLIARLLELKSRGLEPASINEAAGFLIKLFPADFKKGETAAVAKQISKLLGEGKIVREK
jgi:hypothetical protein